MMSRTGSIRPVRDYENMKRINRKKLIEEFESLRMGFRSAYDFVAKTRCHKMAMRAHHFFANNLVAKYGGEKVEDIEESPCKTKTAKANRQHRTGVNGRMHGV
jgi:uncharacterized protein YggL (DUF469 family)